MTRTAYLLGAVLMFAHTSEADEIVEVPAQPELTLELDHLHQMGNTFVIRSATYLLDGKELVQLKGPEIEKLLSSGPQFYRCPLPPGLHVIAIRLIYSGKSGLFNYVTGYRFTMKGYLLVESKPGYGIKIISSAEERDPLTVQWQNRPLFKLRGLPQKAVLRVRVSPIQRTQGDPEQEPEPFAVTLSEEDAKLLQASIAQPPPPFKPAASAPPPPAPPVAPSAPSAPACGPAAVQFALGQSTLDRSARKSLEQLAACLLRAPASRLRIEGHCDERGSHALNDRLGLARARATVNFLVLRGVNPDRLEAASLGKRRPICEERTESCHAKNRRADFIAGPSADKLAPSASNTASIPTDSASQ